MSLLPPFALLRSRFGISFLNPFPGFSVSNFQAFWKIRDWISEEVSCVYLESKDVSRWSLDFTKWYSLSLYY